VNLLSNAAKATSARGEVRLSCALDKDRVLVRVSDTGTGIPRDKLEAIFSPFTQLGRSLKTPRAGAGLGLSISRGLAEAMGGSLKAASHLGTGSTFTLTLLRG
jgi:signal transduction histidine kinase